MNLVVPAILPKSRDELDTALTRLAPIVAIKTVQIDIVDGTFAKPASWPYADHSAFELPMTERFRYDLDLMVNDPEASIARWVELGASRITLHAESTASLQQVIADFKKRYGHEAGFTPGLLSLGLAISMPTPISMIEPYLSEIDYVQLMGIAIIGRQGEPLDRGVLPKIRTLHANYPHLAIQIDGGVSLTTAPELLALGVTRLVVGSALMRASDISVELAKFESVSKQYGIYE